MFDGFSREFLHRLGRFFPETSFQVRITIGANSVFRSTAPQMPDTSIPIWLRVGSSPAFGEKHIQDRHGHWVKRHNMTVPELVYFKLGQHGNVYCTEKNSKIKVTLTITPSALLVLDLITHIGQPHFSVTTLYHHQGPLDGRIIGRYKGRPKVTGK
jgi:hypothetical protein